MIPKYPNFQTIDLGTKDTIAYFLNKYQPTVCELSLGNIYAWAEVDQSQVTLINDNLCFLLKHPTNEYYFLEPVGNNLIGDTLDICLKHCSFVSCISEEFLSKLTDKEKYKITEIPEQFDYVYLIENLVTLKGQKYAAKRNHMHKFKHSYPHFQVHPIDVSFAPQSLAFFEQWAREYVPSADVRITLAMQESALKGAFQFFSCCDFKGLYIEAAGRLLGFILGTPLNHDTFVVHFQYGLHAVPGIFQTLLQLFCKDLQSKYTFINLEQDLGIPGLRKMKLSYNPDKIEKKYEIALL